MLVSAGCALSTGNGIAQTELPAVLAFRNPGCACCEKWATLLENAGFKVSMTDDSDLPARRKALGVPESLAGCHVAQIGRYIIEGHVPVEDILRVLDQKPDVLGLAVPGMPAGSPGMETDGEVDRYSVLVFREDGSSEVYSQH
jgi:hypothetical protein